MLIKGVKEFESLTRSQLEALRTHASASRVRIKDLVEHNYDWLLTDFKEHNWTVLDHHGNEFTLNFDSPLFGGGFISDNHLLIEDLKTYFVAAKTKQLRECITLNSESSCKCFVRAIKRYVIQSMALEGVTNPNMLEKHEFDSVIDSMARKLPNSLGYGDILQEYFNNTQVDAIPIKRFKNNKAKPYIDAVSISEELGLNHDYVRQCEQCRHIFAKATESAQAHYVDDALGSKWSKFIDIESFRTMQGSADYGRSLRVLDGVHSLYPAFKDLFNYDLVKYTFCRDTWVAKQDFSEELTLTQRTRDIPPLLFLKLMEGACRFILDYADDLFDAEDKFSAVFDEKLKEGTTPYQAGREINEVIKFYKSDDNRAYTPFPLSAYKHAQDQGGSKYKDILADFIKDDEAGILTKRQVCEKHGVPFGSLLMMRKMAYTPSSSTGLSLHKALYKFLPFCCTTVIMALTARREMEVFGLQAGCVSKDYQGNLWITSYVAKTLQDEYKFSTVAIVEKAVKILERLSESARKATGSNSIFLFDDTFDRPPSSMKSITHIADDFFDHIGIGRNDDGEHWKLSEHQFRRFFAIMYFYRYSSTNTEALMHELGHRVWSMTLRYLSQKRTAEAMAEFDKQLQDIQAERIADLAGRSDLDGEMFKSLQGMLTKNLKNVTGVEGKAQQLQRDAFIKRVKENSLVIDFIPTGLCFGNTPKLKPNCKCLKGGHVQMHKASDDMCRDCPAQLTVPEIAAGELHNLSSIDDGRSIILDGLKSTEAA
ncbi:site-specific integrase [Vibrio breoganii]|uniref:site-specific integrase n=1 Tax=Vibrio breoganii TaxID=553239 RepID=UPI000C82EDE8|nr:site-specific integrase [Vibrio breoganii]PMG89967.1 hypothetical protein BCU79_18225 [Vibrio breoganii]PMJ48021.1 hypothetical protein BCU21_04915 [Vibrio breoganii]PMK57705.1 hypothetical protein BCT97_09950 [Vibrio breoganii]PMM79571.1 hypothetical protein BCT44_15020 [Vibrio breoganii]PMO27169.1 hypothetical protein BCT14_13460 [Vibrio breoganii]